MRLPCFLREGSEGGEESFPHCAGRHTQGGDLQKGCARTEVLNLVIAAADWYDEGRIFCMDL